MRALIALPAIALLAACQVTKDDANDSVTVEYNQDVAEDAASDAGNVAEDVAGKFGNEVDPAGDKIENTSVGVDVDTTTAN
jgi:hypothetical protein